MTRARCRRPAPVNVAPEHGDVVIEEEGRGKGRTFVLRTVPGPGQLQFRSRDAAVSLAVMFAMRRQVQAWEQEEGVWRPIQGPALHLQRANRPSTLAQRASDAARLPPGRRAG